MPRVFHQVLIYDFFANSSISASDWRVVLHGLTEEQKLGRYIPAFEDARHNAIQLELKSLYVAITRARKNVWIWETSDVGNAMMVGYTPQMLLVFVP